jgi:hypothetical protein
MIDNLIYVDPFLLKCERELFVHNYKKIQKEIRDSNMTKTQTIFRSDSISDIPKLASDCFMSNRVLVVVRENGVFEDPSSLGIESNGIIFRKKI